MLEHVKQEGLVDISATTGDLFAYPEEEGLMFKWSKFTRDKLVFNVEHYMHPLPDYSKEVLETLSKDFKLFYVTARSGELEHPTRVWAEVNELPQRENLIVTANPNKAIHIMKNEIEIFVEDRPSSIEHIAEHTSIILLSQPWNIQYMKNNHVRIDILEELIPMLVGEKND